MGISLSTLAAPLLITESFAGVSRKVPVARFHLFYDALLFDRAPL